MPHPARNQTLSARTAALLREYEHLMGRRPDGEIARLVGLDRRNVVLYRQLNGIRAYDRLGRSDGDGAPDGAVRGFRRSRLDAFVQLMGNVPDGQIALLAGCSRETVMRYRSRHGIEAVPRGAPPGPAARSPVTPLGAHGYLVTADHDGERREYVVVAQDIAAAAHLACDLLARGEPVAEILALRHHAPLLG